MKAAAATASFVLVTKDRGVAALRRMEETVVIKPGTFRCFEAIYVPSDFKGVLTRMETGGKMTSAKVREFVGEIMAERWLDWCILHPDLGPQHIHPARSMWGFLIEARGKVRSTCNCLWECVGF